MNKHLCKYKCKSVSTDNCNAHHQYKYEIDLHKYEQISGVHECTSTSSLQSYIMVSNFNRKQETNLLVHRPKFSNPT